VQSSKDMQHDCISTLHSHAGAPTLMPKRHLREPCSDVLSRKGMGVLTLGGNAVKSLQNQPNAAVSDLRSTP